MGGTKVRRMVGVQGRGLVGSCSDYARVGIALVLLFRLSVPSSWCDKPRARGVSRHSSVKLPGAAVIILGFGAMRKFSLPIIDPSTPTKIAICSKKVDKKMS